MSESVIRYIATSREEFARLEEAMGRFEKSYGIQGGPCLMVSAGGGDNCVRIFPVRTLSPESDLISEIMFREGKGLPEGTAVRITPKHKLALIELEGTNYHIDFEPREII